MITTHLLFFFFNAGGGGGGPVTSGLLMHLDAGNPASYPGSGTAWNDLSGNGNNGTLNGAAFSSGDGGQIIFDGIDDYVSTTLTQPSVTSYTIEVWIKTTDSLNGGLAKSFVSNRGSGAGVSLDLGINPFEGDIGAYWAGAQSDNFIVQAQTDAATYNDNAWRQVVGVFSQSSGSSVTSSSFSIYVDGQLVSVNAGALQYDPGGLGVSPIGPGLGGTELMRAQAWGTYTSGSLAIVRIYNTALDADDVLQNYDANKNRFFSGLGDWFTRMRRRRRRR